ncbi:hypothetical protein ABT086_44125 [Streptomyces mirabilis]
MTIAWELATGTDIRYPGAIGEQPGATRRLLGRYVERLLRTAAGRPLVAQAFLAVLTLSAPLSALVRPEVAVAVLRGPRRPPLTEPPLTAEEWETVLSVPEPSGTPAVG